VVRAKSEDTVYTDAFAINWPPNSPVRVIANSLTDELGQRLLGHDPDDILCEAIAEEGGRPIYKFSTDSPLRTTTGELGCLALFAGQVAGAIETSPSTGERVEEIVSAAHVTLERLQRVAAGTH
jgi:nitronate monooxygenase